MRRTLLLLGFISALPFVSPGCAVEDVGGGVEDVARGADAIIGGTSDTGNQAVVWVYNENGGSSCSGTIIGTSGSTGYVLTAAHCEGMTVVVQANDFTDCFNQGNPGCLGVWTVTNDTPHPSWNGDPGNGYDFRILQISNAAGAPVIPASSNDGLSVGTAVEVSGFGATFAGDQNNSLRRHVTENVAELYSNAIVAYQNDGTGSCSGDSGGPVLYNGTVVGVTSFGDANCTQYGAYGRVEFVYASFIAPIVGTNPSTTSSGPTTSNATSAVGVGGGPGEGGSGGDGAGAGVDTVDPDDDYEWYPGKQDGKDEDGDSSSCSSAGGAADSSLVLLALVGLAGALKRRVRAS